MSNIHKDTHIHFLTLERLSGTIRKNCSMKQKHTPLFNYDRTLTKDEFQKSKELPWYEDTICPNLEFILVPYAILLGMQSQGRSSIPTPIAQGLIKELLSPINSTLDEHVVEQIERYITAEAGWIKKNPMLPLRGVNRLNRDEFAEMLAYGAMQMKKAGGSLYELKRRLRSEMPKNPHLLKFSRIGRYFVNGSKDRDWYIETGKEIAELFSGFEPALIASLLSITSIRNTVATNATKFFKALKQFYAKEIYTVLIGERGSKKAIKSSFEGFVDASLIHLNSFKSGEPLIDAEKRNARKIRNFADAMLDNVEAIVADIWIMRSFGCDLKYAYHDRLVSRAPTRKLYDAIEWYLRTLGSKSHNEPRSLCSMVWSGIRQETSVTSTRYTDTLKKRLNHGLFIGHYGKLIIDEEKGVSFEELK